MPLEDYGAMGQTSIDIDYQCPNGRGKSYNETIVSKECNKIKWNYKRIHAIKDNKDEAQIVSTTESLTNSVVMENCSATS